MHARHSRQTRIERELSRNSPEQIVWTGVKREHLRTCRKRIWIDAGRERAPCSAQARRLDGQASSESIIHKITNAFGSMIVERACIIVQQRTVAMIPLGRGRFPPWLRRSYVWPWAFRRPFRFEIMALEGSNKAKMWTKVCSPTNRI